MSAEPGSSDRHGHTPLTHELGPVGLAPGEGHLPVDRAHLYGQLDSTRQTLEALRDALAAATGEPFARPVERLLSAVRALDEARSLSAVLSALVERAGEEAPRIALFLVEDGGLHGWKATGFTPDVSSVRLAAEAEGLFEEALRGEAPAFALLPAGAWAMAVPLLVGSRPVAVLYADEGDGSPGRTSSPWHEAIQILSRHASANLAHLTAARTVDVLRHWLAPGSLSPAVPGASA